MNKIKNIFCLCAVALLFRLTSRKDVLAKQRTVTLFLCVCVFFLSRFFPEGVFGKTCCVLSPAAVLWCSGSHIYGVSEGQWGLLPGSARCLCRRVNGGAARHPPDTPEPQEGPGALAGPGLLPEPAASGQPGWGNSTRCTLPPVGLCLARIKVEPALLFTLFSPFLSFHSE